MHISKKVAALIILLVLILSGMYFYEESMEAVNEGEGIAKIGEIEISYDADEYIYTEEGFWGKETYENFRETTDIGPAVRVSFVRSEGRILEEVAIEDKSFGAVYSFAELDIFTRNQEDPFSYGYEEIGDYYVLWVHAHEKFDTTSYYFEKGDYTYIFSSVDSSENKLSLMKEMILSTQ